MSKRQLQKTQTRKHLIGKAYEVYSEHGFSVAASEIAKYAGVSNGTVFLHFPTVSDLINCIVEDFSGMLTSKLHDKAANAGTVRSYLEVHIDTISEYEPFYSRLVTEQNLLPESARTSFICMQSAVAHHLDELLENDELYKKIPVHVVFNCWVGLLHYYIQNRNLFATSGAVLKKNRELLVEAFMNMITK